MSGHKMTEAEMQIKKLKEMKREKTRRDKKPGKNYFSNPVPEVDNNVVQIVPEKRIRPKTKKENVVILTKENNEKLVRLSLLLKTHLGDKKFSKSHLANMILAEVVKTPKFIESCTSKGKLEKAMKKIRVDRA